jgi:hypothetical protein
MAEIIKELKTRVALRTGDYAYWTTGAGKDISLYKGEVCICTIQPKGHPYDDAGQETGKAHTAPTVLFKVADANGKKFADLDWVSGLAADVYAWAKKANPDWTDFPALPLEVVDNDPGKFVTDFTYADNKLTITRSDVAWTDVTGRVDGVKAVLKDGYTIAPITAPDGTAMGVSVDQISADSASFGILAVGQQGITIDDKDVATQEYVDTKVGNIANIDVNATTKPTDIVGAINTVRDELEAAINVGGTGSVVTVVKDTTSAGSEATYTVKQGNEQVGVKIEIPKYDTSADYGVLTVDKGDDTIVVDNTDAQNPKIKVAANKFDAYGAAADLEEKLCESGDLTVKYAEHADEATTAASVEGTLTVKVGGNTKTFNGSTDVEADVDAAISTAIGTRTTYTNTEIDNKVGSVLGQSTDGAAANTVYGAKAAAAAAQNDATIAKTKIETFLGTITPDGSQDIIDTLTEINNYVGEHGEEFAALSEKVTNIENGTTVVPKASDADTLDGKQAADFADATENGAKALAQGVKDVVDANKATWDKAGTALQAADIAGKADKKVPATAGNFAALDANGNLADSGKKAADFQPAGNYKTKQAVRGDDLTGATVVGEWEQDENGVITIGTRTLTPADIGAEVTGALRSVVVEGDGVFTNTVTQSGNQVVVTRSNKIEGSDFSVECDDNDGISISAAKGLNLTSGLGIEVDPGSAGMSVDGTIKTDRIEALGDMDDGSLSFGYESEGHSTHLDSRYGVSINGGERDVYITGSNGGVVIEETVNNTKFAVKNGEVTVNDNPVLTEVQAGTGLKVAEGTSNKIEIDDEVIFVLNANF